MGLFILLCFSAAHAGVLESPADGAVVSGIGFISGWKCSAGTITVRLDGGGHIPLATEQPRADTRLACGTLTNGFITQVNWNHLGTGTHTAVAYDDGVAFAWSTFTVGTADEEFIRGVEAECLVPDFPAPGETGRFVWNESTQHLELAEVGFTEPEGEDEEPDEEEPADPSDYRWPAVESCFYQGIMDVCCFCCKGGERARAVYPDCNNMDAHPVLQGCNGCRGFTPEPEDPYPLAPYLGIWDISAEITHGCPASVGQGAFRVEANGTFSFVVRFTEGATAVPRYEVIARVSPDGVVEPEPTFSAYGARFNGRLYEDGSGSGTWHDANSNRACRGVWQATRR